MFTDDNYWFLIKSHEARKENSRQKRRRSILKKVRKKELDSQPYMHPWKKRWDALDDDTFVPRDDRRFPKEDLNET